MCTAINVKLNDTYFGRNLDLDYIFDANIIVVPRNYEIKFKREFPLLSHYAMLGVGTIVDNYPLYADVINEKGLSIAALNFPFNAKYYEYDANKLNLATYELILYLMGTCASISDVKRKLKFINVLNEEFSKEIKLTPLHFLISDKDSSIVLETTIDGMKVYDNPHNILTNNPPFNYQLEYLSSFLNLSNESLDPDKVSIASQLFYSYGGGAYGLPGDFSSASRIIKANFVKNYLVPSFDELENVRSFFSVLDSVYMPYGSIKTVHGYEHTMYTTCYNLNRGILYYKTYENPNINEVSFASYDLDQKTLFMDKFNKEFRLV